MAKTARATPARVVVPLARRRKRQAPLAAIVPNGATIAFLFGALALAIGLYVLARESSLFSIDKVTVKGAPPVLTRKIEAAVAKFRGRSLVELDEAAIERAVLSIPEVRAVRIDRDFPNTLRVFVGRERPVAVLRRGQEAWLIAASGKIVRPFPLGHGLGIPRIWISRSVEVSKGEPVRDPGVKTAIKLLASLGPEGHGLELANVVASRNDLTVVTSSGIELRFGNASQPALKLAVVAKILPDLGPPRAGSITYLDVSVPDRPMAGTTLKSKV